VYLGGGLPQISERISFVHIPPVALEASEGFNPTPKLPRVHANLDRQRRLSCEEWPPP